MNRLLLWGALLANVVLLGCAGRAVGTKPVIVNPSETAEVFVFRNKNVLGMAKDILVVFNDSPLIELSTGEYTKFLADVGVHNFSAVCGGGWAPGEHTNTKQIAMKKGERYYVMARIGGLCAVIEPMNQEKAEPYITGAKFIPLKELSNTEQPTPNTSLHSN